MAITKRFGCIIANFIDRIPISPPLPYYFLAPETGVSHIEPIIFQLNMTNVFVFVHLSNRCVVVLTFIVLGLYAVSEKFLSNQIQ